jgi:hypothetical protein
VDLIKDYSNDLAKLPILLPIVIEAIMVQHQTIHQDPKVVTEQRD